LLRVQQITSTSSTSTNQSTSAVESALSFSSSSSSTLTSDHILKSENAVIDSSSDLRRVREELINKVNAQSARVNEFSAAKESGGHVVYRGQSAYTSFVKKDATEAVAKAKVAGTLGPGRAPTNVRGIVRVDYQPAICKDYKETGTCSFGDSCVFLHDRSEHKSSYLQDLEWQAKQKRKKERLAARLAAGGNEEEDDEDEDDDVDIPGFKQKNSKKGSGTWADSIIGLDGKKLHKSITEESAQVSIVDSHDKLPPHACFICRNSFTQPVQTQCGHTFCEQCASIHHRTNPLCAVCGKPTHGIFNAAKPIAQLQAIRQNRLAVESSSGIAEEKRDDERTSSGWSIVN